jgi:hypothetical protein
MWKTYPENKPDDDAWCFVMNYYCASGDRCGYNMFPRVATYRKNTDVFVNYPIDNGDALCLDVTHYIEIPSVQQIKS